MPILPPCNPPNDYGHYKGSAANHNYVFENVVDVLKGRTSISTNALEGLKVVDIIERIYAWRPREATIYPLHQMSGVNNNAEFSNRLKMFENIAAF
jgi:hypothetical protein